MSSSSSADRAPQVVALGPPLIVIPTVAVALRIWSRTLIHTSGSSRARVLWWDDWLIMMCLVSIFLSCLNGFVLIASSLVVWLRLRSICRGPLLGSENTWLRYLYRISKKVCRSFGPCSGSILLQSGCPSCRHLLSTHEYSAPGIGDFASLCGSSLRWLAPGWSPSLFPSYCNAILHRKPGIEPFPAHVKIPTTGGSPVE